MVRSYKRKTVSYDKEAMVKVVEKVLSGEMGYKKAVKDYDLKKETIRDNVKKRYTKMGAGRNTAISSDEEIELSECLKILTRWGFGLTRCETKELVQEYKSAWGRENPFTDILPGYLRGNWARNGPAGAKYNVSENVWVETTSFHD